MEKEPLNLIDKMTDKVKNKLDKIPHRKEEESLDEYKKEITKKEDVNKNLQRKVNRLTKDLGVSRNREKIVNKKRDKVLKENKVLKKEIRKMEKRYSYVDVELKGVKEESEELRKKVEFYEERDKGYREEGILVEDLLETISTLEEVLEEQKELNKKEQQKFRRHKKSLVKNVKGEKRAKDRALNDLEEMRVSVKPLRERLNSLEDDKKQLEDKNKKTEDRLREVRKELREVLGDKERLIKLLVDGMDVSNLKEYQGLEGLYELYQAKEKELEERKLYLGEHLGYVIKEEGDYYFTSLEDNKVYRIDEVLRGIKVEDGLVCRAALYKGKVAKVNKLYKNHEVTHKNYKGAVKERVMKVQKNKKKLSKLGTEFYREVHKYNVLILTAKDVPMYKEYFHRYSVIEVVDPYSEGIRKVQNKMDKVDIVLVRTDAVPHWVTDYLKDHHKEKTVQMNNPRVGEVANTIYVEARKKKLKEE